MEVVIDSSVLVALLVPNDLWHTQAVALWEAIEVAGHRVVYLDCVAAESISVATRRLREKGRLADIDRLFDRLNTHTPGSVITWVLPDVPRLYSNILALMRTSGTALNFHDALIALSCQERKIPAIASFDTDFDQVAWLRRLACPEDVPPS